MFTNAAETRRVTMQAPDKAILSDDVRKQNRFRILRAFRQTQSLSRTQLAEITGLSPGTISNITTQLLADGILRIAEPDSAPDTRQGRPRVQLTLNAGHATIASGSLTYGRLTLRLSDYSGDKIASATQDFDTEGQTARNAGLRHRGPDRPTGRRRHFCSDPANHRRATGRHPLFRRAGNHRQGQQPRSVVADPVGERLRFRRRTG
jgi:transcriptional regulator with XRE-family HTH domain